MKFRPRLILTFASLALAVDWSSCATMPDTKYERHTFPKNAFVGDVQRPYVKLGPVRSKVDFMSLDEQREEKELCKNYYNKSVRELIKFAKKQGADAVIGVESVVFLEDGRREVYKTPECSDDGGEGQVLTQGIAVKWQGSNGPETGSWTQTGVPPIAVVPVPVPAPSPTLVPAPRVPAGMTEGQTFAEPETIPSTPSSAPATVTTPPEPEKMAAVKMKLDSVEESPEPRRPVSRPTPAQFPASPPAVQRINLADPRGIAGTLRQANP